MAKKNRREIDRREFLKVLGVGTATTTAALYGCSLKDGSVTVAGGSGNTPAGEMTYRINPSTEIRYPYWDMAVCVAGRWSKAAKMR